MTPILEQLQSIQVLLRHLNPQRVSSVHWHVELGVAPVPREPHAQCQGEARVWAGLDFVSRVKPLGVFTSPAAVADTSNVHLHRL